MVGSLSTRFYPMTDNRADQYLDDTEISKVCQEAVSHVYRLLRQIVRVKKILREIRPMSDTSTLCEDLEMSFSIVENFNSSYGQFCDQCMTGFSALSETSKLSSGMFRSSDRKQS